MFGPVRENPDTIAHLVLKADEESMCNLFELFYGRVFAAAMVIVCNHAAAEDIVQETFIRAFKHLGELREGKKFGAWVVTIATNLARDYLKKEKKILLSPEPLLVESISPAEDYVVEEQVFKREKAEWIRAGLRILPAEQQQVIILHYYYDQKIEDIASALNISLGTIKSRLYRARSRLYKILTSREQNIADNRLSNEKNEIEEIAIDEKRRLQP